MTNYLQKYAASTRQKVDMELADRFDFKMRREGDKPIRLQMAKARRAATTMKNLLDDFKDMPPKQMQELMNSAKTLRKLADDLEGLARFAKGYQSFYLAEIKREEDEELEAFALKRWGRENATAEFEWALIRDLETLDGRAELGQWMHGRGNHKSVGVENFHSPFHSAHDMHGTNKRREAAKAIRQAQSQHNQYTELSFNGVHCHVGMRDYESFLADRKAAASLTHNIVQVAKVGSQ